MGTENTPTGGSPVERVVSEQQQAHRPNEICYPPEVLRLFEAMAAQQELLARHDERPSDAIAWLQMWCATANAETCFTPDRAAIWADAGLADFRNRFSGR